MHKKEHKMHMQLQTSNTAKNTHSFVNGKDGAYGGQTVDVGGAIQRIKTDHIFPL